MATNTVLPRLRSLRVLLVHWQGNHMTSSANIESLPDVNSLNLPMLETLEMDLRPPRDIVWANVKPLTLPSVMPRLRDCTLIYEAWSAPNVQGMFSTPVFFNDERNVRVRFAIHLRAPDFEGPYRSRLSKLSTRRYNEIYVEYVSRWMRLNSLK
jgi:hypothetical protein